MFQKMASKLRQAASDLKCARDCSEKLEEAFEAWTLHSSVGGPSKTMRRVCGTH